MSGFLSILRIDGKMTLANLTINDGQADACRRADDFGPLSETKTLRLGAGQPQDRVEGRWFAQSDETRHGHHRIWWRVTVCPISNLNTFNPIRWWNDAKSTFPTLHLWAFDTLAIPAISTEYNEYSVVLRS